MLGSTHTQAGDMLKAGRGHCLPPARLHAWMPRANICMGLGPWPLQTAPAPEIRGSFRWSGVTKVCDILQDLAHPPTGPLQGLSRGRFVEAAVWLCARIKAKAPGLEKAWDLS